MKLDGKTKFDFTVKSLVLATKGTYHCTEDEACNALHKALNNRHIRNEIVDKIEDYFDRKEKQHER